MIGWLWVACSHEYHDRVTDFRDEMAPLVATVGKLDPADLRKGDLSLAAGRRALFLQHGAAQYLAESVNGVHTPPTGVAARRDQVGVVVFESSTRDPVASVTYPDGTHGYVRHFTFVAVAIPEDVVVAEWSAVVPPANEKSSVLHGDIDGIYVDEPADAARLTAGERPR